MLIAQISDIHASPTNDSIARLDRVMSWLAVLQPDLLVVSGDLIDGNWPEGYGLISASLHRLACRSLILPGNSDDRAVMRAIMPQAEHWYDRSAMHFIEPYGGALIIGSTPAWMAKPMVTSHNIFPGCGRRWRVARTARRCFSLIIMCSLVVFPCWMRSCARAPAPWRICWQAASNRRPRFAVVMFIAACRACLLAFRLIYAVPCAPPILSCSMHPARRQQWTHPP